MNAEEECDELIADILNKIYLREDAIEELDTEREPGAACISKMVKLPPNCS
jgi:hypothetical protein